MKTYNEVLEDMLDEYKRQFNEMPDSVRRMLVEVLGSSFEAKKFPVSVFIDRCIREGLPHPKVSDAKDAMQGNYSRGFAIWVTTPRSMANGADVRPVPEAVIAVTGNFSTNQWKTWEMSSQDAEAYEKGLDIALVQAGFLPD